MDKKKLIEVIEAMVKPITDELNLELVDVEYVREKDWFLRIYINKPGGIDIDDCQAVSSKVTKLLDESDPIKEKYYLEVSSPGIDRPLKKDKDFVDNYGKKVDIQFFAPVDGQKQLTAVLNKHDEATITVQMDKEEKVLERKTIVNIRPHIEF